MLRRLIRLKRKEYRIGKNAKCKYCSETDLRALDKIDDITLCRNCRLAKTGKSVIEQHHLSGRNNDDFLVALPANEHAILSDYQEDWPEETMKNPNKDSLLHIAAWLRANSDFCEHAIERGRSLADFLEKLSRALVKKFGSNWNKHFDLDGKNGDEE